MCGIAGYSGDFTRALLGAFVRILEHRGPDDFGTFCDDAAKVGLAHRRLSIIDLSPRGHQPMVHAESGCVITYNGELYNFRALRSQLEARGHTFVSDSDTEVVLRLYVEYGLDMLEKLDGIFAFAIWDPRSREVVLVRDQMGVKPLYFAETPRGVLFASEIKALLASPDLPRTLDLRAIDATIRYLWCPGPRTVLEAVHKVEPGTALRIRDGKIIANHRYWTLPVQEPWSDAPSYATGDTRIAMERVLERTVTSQMVSDVPIGAFLSGGLDSSAVVAVAARHAQHLPCFTMRFETGQTASEGFEDDLSYARVVARHLRTELVEVPVRAVTADELQAMILQLDEPQADLAPINVGHVAQAARERGIKVLLSGAGGDDLLAGYRRHQAAMLERYWTWLPRPARSGLRYASSALPAGRNLRRRLQKAFGSADRDANERLTGYFDWIDEPSRMALYTPSTRAALERRPAYEPLLRAVGGLAPDLHPVNRLLYLDSRYFLPDHNLNYTDKMAMRYGVEVRVPLVSVEMARFAASLPIQDKLRNNTGKWILREAMRDRLPSSILTRSKTGFGVPLRTWIHRELASLVGDVLSPASLATSQLFDPASVARLIDADRAGRVDAAYPILAMVCVELWCREFSRGATHA